MTESTPVTESTIAKDPGLLPDGWTDLDSRAVDTVRVLAADAVHPPSAGHPGTAMSLAPVAYLLFQKVMRHDPSDTHWVGRDRFVLSAGHSCLTLYIQLYLGGFGLELDDIKSLRTWGSRTPGHPEHGHTDGVEVTTGPLGQGIGNAIGMAMAARRERGLLRVALGGHRHVFAGRHRHGSGQQSGEARRQEGTAVAGGSGDADDDARRGDHAVVGAEDRGAQPVQPRAEAVAVGLVMRLGIRHPGMFSFPPGPVTRHGPTRPARRPGWSRRPGPP